MKTVRHLTRLLLLLGIAAPGWAQTDPFEARVKPSRVAVLPFANYAEVPAVMPQIMGLVRAELRRRGVEQADSATVADVLREHRVRNTNELTADQIQNLSNKLAAAYLLVGSLERYVQGDGGAEVALSARLIHVPTVSIEWVGTASRHTLNGIRLLNLGREPSAEKLAPRAVRDLFRDFRYLRPEQLKRVDWVQFRDGRHSRRQSCERILTLPFSNETDLFTAGGIVTDRIVAALERAGYTVVEPGRAREAMLEVGSITPGNASAQLLEICREQLGANLMLTGTVSRFACGSAVGIDQIPAIAVEARLTDVSTGQVVWAQTFHSDGNATNFLFGTGTCYSVTSVADRVASKLIKAIPAHRARKI
jgi:TolB-like protein